MKGQFPDQLASSANVCVEPLSVVAIGLPPFVVRGRAPFLDSIRYRLRATITPFVGQVKQGPSGLTTTIGRRSRALR